MCRKTNSSGDKGCEENISSTNESKGKQNRKASLQPTSQKANKTAKHLFNQRVKRQTKPQSISSTNESKGKQNSKASLQPTSQKANKTAKHLLNQWVKRQTKPQSISSTNESKGKQNRKASLQPTSQKANKTAQSVSFFSFCVPQLRLWGSRFSVRFLCMWPLFCFNPTIEVVTFHLSGWCMLGVTFCHRH